MKQMYLTTNVCQKTNRFFKWSICLLLLVTQFALQAQTTLRLYLVGNSVTDAINYSGLQAIAQSQGNTHVWARHMIPGAPLSWLWDNQNSGFTESPYGPPNNAFSNYTWDAITLQPFDCLIEGTGNDKLIIDNYINLAKGKSPNVQFYIYSRWPRMPNNNNSLASCTACTADEWNKLWQRTFTGGWDGTNESKDFFEKLLVAVRGYSSISKPVLMIPVGDVFSNLNNKMKNGQIAGYTSIWQVYSDGIHMNSVGSYIAALTFYSTLYKRDPRGTAVPSQYGTISAGLTSAIQTAVWEVVSTHIYSGVSASSVAVTGVSVSPTSATLTNGQTTQLTATVTPSNATNKTVTWSSSNTLVASVNASGLVTANGAGTATITATTADGGRTATATITVNATSGGSGTVGTLAEWEFETRGGSASLASTNKVSQIASAVAAVGPGLTAFNYLSNGLTATNSTATDLAGALSGNKYFSITLQPVSGQSYSVSRIDLTPVSQDLIRTFTLFSSRIGFSASNALASYTAQANLNGNKIVLNISNHTNINTTTEFRIYVHGAGGNMYQSVGFGNAAGMDLSVIGSVGTGDTQAPTAATGLTVSNLKATTLSLTWTNATDNVGVIGYDVFNGSTKLNTALLTTNVFNATGLTACTNYSLTVRAYDAAGNISNSTALAAKTNCAPTAVISATPTTGVAPLSVNFSAANSSDPDNGDFILGYEWDFGDGSAVSNANAPTKVYNTAGTYTVKLRVMDNRDLYSAQVTQTINVSGATALRTPENPSNTVNGLEYRYYEGSWDVLPNFASLTTVKSGDVANISLEPRNRNDNFGFEFAGFITVPTDGEYTFFTTSDDGSKLFIGTSEVVNNDGLHGMQERSGTIGLKAGTHAVRIIFFEKTGGEGLEVRYQGPGIAKTLVPNTAWSRKAPLRNPENPANTTSGLQYRYFEGAWNQLPDFNSLSVVKSGFVSNISLDDKNRADNFGFEFTGFVQVLSDGEYTFFTTSDDGSKLFIGSTEVVNNDGLHGMQERSGTIGLKAGKHAIRIIFFENTGGEGLEVRYQGPGIAKTLVPASAWSRTVSTGTINFETWTGVSGTAVSDIPLSSTPSTSSTLSSIEIPTNVQDNYGSRIRGYVIPSTSGTYTFYIAGDDNCELYLSTNQNPTNKTRIAYVNGWTNSREWNKYTSQRSSDLNLIAGTMYYIEVLHKESGGGDNLAVGWIGPGISTISVIGGSNIAPFQSSGGTTTPPADTQAPSVPTGLVASNVAQTSLTLTWAASTDNVGVTAYEVYRNGVLSSSTSSTSANITGLTAGTTYSFTVRARDAAGNWSAQSIALNVSTQSATTTPPTGTPKLPIGMNIHSTNYFTTGLIYTDVMKTASEMFTFYDGGPWNSEQINNVPRDINGYPTQIPYFVGGNNQKVRFLINNHYSGRYRVLYDGVGSLKVNAVSSTVVDGKLYIDLNGNGGHVWIDIVQSQAGNHIRNIRIVPQAMENGGWPTFLPSFIDGLRPFHALRFMDWTATNNSTQKNWSDRPTPSYFSQSTSKGQSIEHAIELANLLNAHAWFCVPHMASDDYMRNMARLIRDNLNSNLKVYIEYSNEVWNWQFSQSTWVLNNAPGSVDSYVMSDLASINPNAGNHPEKDAYMFARTFRLFKQEFTGANAARLIKVAPVQHSWYDNTRRVLQYLRDVNQQCDVVSPAGYFNFKPSDHSGWLSRCGTSNPVTASEVCQSALDDYDATSGLWTQKNGEYAQQFGVGYVVYEGGQHMQPHEQGQWCYNDAVWDAQIHPKMYDLYMKNFAKHIEPTVNCSLFMAFAYVGERKSQYGSWGHLENLAQVGRSDLRTVAPKYQALLDANTSKSTSREATLDVPTLASGIQVTPVPVIDVAQVIFKAPSSAQASLIVYNMSGLPVLTQSIHTIEGANAVNVNLTELPSGVYVLKIHSNDMHLSKKIVKE